MTDATLPESDVIPGDDAAPSANSVPDPGGDVKGAGSAPDDAPEVDVNTFLDAPALTAPEGDAPTPPAHSAPAVNTPQADVSSQQAALNGVTLNKDGTPRKKRGRKPGQTNTPAQITQQTPQIDDVIVGTAQFTVDAITGALAMMIGPEWQAEKDERETLIAQTAHYFRTQNISDIPPGVLLAIVCAGYAMKRVQNENTATKLKVFAVRAWGAIKNVTGLFGRK
jgi:hypothetical protein